MANFTTINKSTDFFNTVLYTGNGTAIGSGENAITGVGHQPDLVWIKSRGATEEHVVTDSVRGVTKTLKTNATAAEYTSSEGLNTFGSDGFTVGNSDQFNTNSGNYVSWNWKGGTTSGITTNGSTTITPSAYSFNATSGVACLLYTGNGTAGAKLAHGMGKTPKFFMVKRQNDASESWTGYHASAGATKFLSINGTGAAGTATNRWIDTAPDSVNITLGSEGSVNSDGNPLICYAFCEVAGFSSIGYYIGNGSANGCKVWTGMKPSFVMTKYDGTENWAICDNKRDGYNVNNDQLYANATNAEVSNTRMDITSDGFKCRTTNAEWNGNNNTYYYIAFGQSIVGTNNVCATAR